MNDFLKQLAAENKAIRESAVGSPRLVAERMVVEAAEIVAVQIMEASGAKPGYRVAKVSHADRMNQNHRVYPHQEWRQQADHANSVLVPSGRLIGAIDHAGMLDGGSLKDSPILWKRLEVREDGSVDGEFVIIEGHSRGADLKAQIDAGMAIGFSTVGYANGRSPTEDERERYGIERDDEHAVIIENFRLKKIDAVDDPSVIDAWMKSESTKPAAVRNEQSTAGGSEQEPLMKTLTDLQAKHPEVHALHEQAIREAVAAALAPVEAEKQTAIGKSEALSADLEKVQSEHDAALSRCEESKTLLAGLKQHLAESIGVLKALGVEVPFREVTEQEAFEKIEALTLQNEGKDAEIVSLKAKVEAAEAEKAAAAVAAEAARVAAEGAAREAQRKADVTAKAEELLKDNRFAEQIRKFIAQRSDDKAFDVAALQSLVTAKTDEYDAIAAPVSDPGLGLEGLLTLPEGEPAQKHEALPCAEELAKSL